MDTRPKIFVSLPTATYLHREMLEGILSYARTNGPWSFHLNLEDFNVQPLRRIRTWGCTGIIALVRSARESAPLVSARIPMVVLGAARATRLPARPDLYACVERDERAVGRLAAETFLRKSYRNFAYVGSTSYTPWSVLRGQGFAARLAEERASAHVFPRAERNREPEDDARESRRLKEWLLGLPRPAGLFVVHDRRAQQVLACAQEVGLVVPRELAILGVDNDSVLCETSAPTLSSISLGGFETGLAAAELLDRIMRRQPHPARIDPFVPQLLERESTDIAAVRDPIVSRILAKLSAEYARPFSLDRFAAELGCSKRILEYKMRREYGSTIREHLLDIRLAEAKCLLAMTDRSVEAIAQQTGFCSASHLGSILKRTTKLTPKMLRRPR